MRHVLITGAAGALGRHVARAFAARGDRLLLLDRDAAALREAHGPDGPGQRSRAVDLLDATAVREALAGEPIEVLAHLVGGFRMGEAVHETADATWSAMFDLNLHSFLRTAGAVVPGMLAAGRGRIVCVGALSAREGQPQMGAYVASKAALQRAAEAMAAELAPRGLRVNCVLPSVIDTPANRAAMPDADPAGWVDPADLAGTLVWLSGDGARGVQGVSLPVTGRV